jgi:hypothetical protein
MELRYAVGMTVIVTVADATVRGRLANVSRKFLALRECSSLSSTGQEPVPLAGELYVPIARLSYVQVVE